MSTKRQSLKIYLQVNVMYLNPYDFWFLVWSAWFIFILRPSAIISGTFFFLLTLQRTIKVFFYFQSIFLIKSVSIKIKHLLLALLYLFNFKQNFYGLSYNTSLLNIIKVLTLVTQIKRIKNTCPNSLRPT